ncbi:DUF4097 family beta strand repeat-containing protein [Phaeacidiphilus oryzae]|uniref:DUF4097 family beta strand repeat-containing protein n=1 Tax=Phaeacidiphilus oryzae TaxID=348818 RepID=UPI000559C7E1|nr:DUF4097 family beta strand repeat-containing protein [Phaeacidiphilus oryzae]
MHTFETTSPIAAVVDIPAGRIQLIAADRADTVVEIRPANPARNRDVKAAEQVLVDYGEGVLRIGVPPARHKVLGHSGAVEVTVQLPAGSRVEAKAAAAELRGVGRLGDVSYRSAQGPVKLDEAASARISLADGGVTVGRLGGAAEIGTQQGDIRITEALGGEVLLSTQKGDISVEAGRGVSGTLDAGTSYGRIDNALRNAEGADAGLRIRATTSYGDITARSR